LPIKSAAITAKPTRKMHFTLSYFLRQL